MLEGRLLQRRLHPSWQQMVPSRHESLSTHVFLSPTGQIRFFPALGQVSGKRIYKFHTKACDVKEKVQCFPSYQERKSLCRFLKLQLHVTVLVQLQSVCRARVNCIIRQCQEYSWIGVEIILCNLFFFLSFVFFFKFSSSQGTKYHAEQTPSKEQVMKSLHSMRSKIASH